MSLQSDIYMDTTDRYEIIGQDLNGHFYVSYNTEFAAKKKDYDKGRLNFFMCFLNQKCLRHWRIPCHN